MAVRDLEGAQQFIVLRWLYGVAPARARVALKGQASAQFGAEVKHPLNIPHVVAVQRHHHGCLDSPFPKSLQRRDGLVEPSPPPNPVVHRPQAV